MMSRFWWWCLSVLALVLLLGCGASSAEAKYGGGDTATAAAPPADTDHDGYADDADRAEADEMAGEAEPEGAAREVGAAPAGAAPPPPPRAPAPAGPSGNQAGLKEQDAPKPAPLSPNVAKPEEKARSPQTSAARQLLIYKATLHMAVFETKKAMDEVEQHAKDNGGYLVSRADTTITVRIPTKKFDQALEHIAKLGDMLHRNVSVEDVTEQFNDAQIRLRNLEVVRNRLEELLKKSVTVTEAIAVERELERVTTEIERLKGRLKLLSELIQFSTITVNFQLRATDHVQSQVRLPFPWLDTLGLGQLLRL